MLPLPLAAVGPSRGLTAQFEVDFRKFTIDHHFGALRVTELAAGTDTKRNSEISPQEGTSPAPEFPSTPAKALLEEVKSLAQRNRRMQREEIPTAQALLQKWYGMTYELRLTDDAVEAVTHLEEVDGKAFEVEFMEIFSHHHFMIRQALAECLVASELRHHDLRRVCRGFIENQVNDFDEMRHLLCEPYGICDYQPLQGMEGQHRQWMKDCAEERSLYVPDIAGCGPALSSGKCSEPLAYTPWGYYIYPWGVYEEEIP